MLIALLVLVVINLVVSVLCLGGFANLNKFSDALSNMLEANAKLHQEWIDAINKENK